MTFSYLTRRTSPHGGKCTPRTSAVDRAGLHHAATTSLGTVLGMMADKDGREVSSNYVIATDGALIGVVPEEYRAFTSGSSSDDGRGAAFDHRAITVEVVNETGSPDWTISEAAQHTLAALLADVAERYNFPLTRGDSPTVLGHRELWERYSASYPTACPGGMPIDHIVTLATNPLGAIMAKPTFVTTDPKGSWWLTDGLTRRELGAGENQLMLDLGVVDPVAKNGGVHMIAPAQLARIPVQK